MKKLPSQSPVDKYILIMGEYVRGRRRGKNNARCGVGVIVVW